MGEKLTHKLCTYCILQDYVKSIPIPHNFDPHRYFGEDDDDDGDAEDKSVSSIQQQKNTTSKIQQQSKLSMSWEEKQQLLHQIYDEEKIPAKLLESCSLIDGEN